MKEQLKRAYCVAMTDAFISEHVSALNATKWRYGWTAFRGLQMSV